MEQTNIVNNFVFVLEIQFVSIVAFRERGKRHV